MLITIKLLHHIHTNGKNWFEEESKGPFSKVVFSWNNCFLDIDTSKSRKYLYPGA